MLEGVYTETILMHPEIRVHPPEPKALSGVTLGSQAIYRYALKDSDYPILIIIDEIKDDDGDSIPAGHYELALSDEMDFLILMQTKTPFAIIPVFKVEEDKKAFDKNRDKEYQKMIQKREKKRAKTNEKRAKVGMLPDEEDIHMSASIEYVKDGGYYLLKYERGTIRAWGAIKSN
ncbi:hypothetical protein IJZ97_05600 [bacterium]|nr:hypothetical protein [bacterium]